MTDRLNRLLLTFSVALVCWTLSLPVLAHAEGEKLADVIVTGNRRVERSTIMSVLKEKKGETYFLDKVDEDIRAIYRLGHFRDVKAELSMNEANEPVLTYRVTEKPVIRDLTFEGTKELSQEKVADAFGMKKNGIYSAKGVAAGVAKIKKLYAEEGYYLADVAVQSDQLASGDLKVKVIVAEGDKVLIRSIRFVGNKSFSRDIFIGNRLLFKGGIMETKESWFFSWLTSAGTYKEEQLKNDTLLIADHYFNNGFINVKVGDPKVTLSPDKKYLDVVIEISEGDQFRFGELVFRGETTDARKELGERLKMKPGEIFNRSHLRADVVSLTDWFADKGYAFANIVPQTRVDQDKRAVDITFDVEKGEKVYIDTINIKGNSKTRDKVIRRELKLAEGDLYGATPIRKSKQALMNLGYFEDATIATARGNADNQMNLNVEVKEKPTGTFSIGAGYSSLDKFVAQGSIQQANFLGLGLKLNASASIGGTSTTYTLGLTDPYFLDTKWTLGGDLYRVEREYTNSYTRRSIGGNIKGGYPLTDEISLFMLYKYEEKTILKKAQQFVEAVRLGQINDENSSTVSAVTLRLSRNTTDYRLDPTTGMTNNLSMEFAGIGGNTRYLRTIADSTLFVPAFWSTVLMTRGTVGTVTKVGKEIAIDEKFYLGGINTVRGYASRTLSPFVTSTGSTYSLYGNGPSSYFSRLYTGGDTEFYANVELLIPLLKDAGLKGVLFYDIGNANDGVGNVFNGLRASYGFGFRWFSPIGPLRLEYGIPLDPRIGIDDKSGRFEFAIGTFF
ncbi:MAG: outer membrane protein assembly factor BamA [Desulfuromonadia bacterium]